MHVKFFVVLNEMHYTFTHIIIEINSLIVMYEKVNACIDILIKKGVFTDVSLVEML